MFDFKSRKVIEALRSGVPSREVSEYFASSRPQMTSLIKSQLDSVINDEKSNGMVFLGRYGEGKTHLLNSTLNMASERNMVVSFISLGKETPFDKLYVIYQKLMANTYLPGYFQNGFLHKINELSNNDPLVKDLLMFANTELETNKLFYLLKSYFETDDIDTKYRLSSDLEGDFVPNALLKNIYKETTHQIAKFDIPFSKTKHVRDYFLFMSYLFKTLGYNGWVILFDETELIGRLGKKARLKAYKNMYYFLRPMNSLIDTFTLFALASSFDEEVIEGKHDLENAIEIYPDDNSDIKDTLKIIRNSKQLSPLTKNEIRNIYELLIELYEKAYEFDCPIDVDTLMESANTSALLLRTKIRSAVEYLDQLYQYGVASKNQTTSLVEEIYTEDIDLEEDRN